MSPPNRIDVHHHFLPSKYAEAAKKYGSEEWPTPDWSVQASQDLCRARGISTAILSLTSPGVDLSSSLSEQLEIAQDANNTGAQVRDNDPSHFGFFATIPNPVKFPDEALTELARAFDELHADGLTLLTCYSGKYLGDKALAPLWTELNRRKAVVFIHPTSPPGEYTLVSKQLLPPALDFTFETTKTACDLILSGSTSKNPDIKIILSHAGGNLPWIWHRVSSLPPSMSMTDMNFDTFRDHARSFYFDCALTGWGPNIEFLLSFAKEGHVFYGSDFPYAPNDLIEDMTKGLDGFLEKRPDLEEKVNFEDALPLFPRLKQHYP